VYKKQPSKKRKQKKEAKKGSRKKRLWQKIVTFVNQ
jgi:hypothetical protein